MAATDPFELVLDKLDVKQRNGVTATARCPGPSHANGDRNPSLSVSRADNGGVVMHCHTGCQTSDVLAAMGLQERDLFVPSERPPRTDLRDLLPSTPKRIVTTYDYVDEDGVLLFQVVRDDPKGFWQRRPDGNGGWIRKLGDTRRVLYRLPELLTDLQRGATAFICEGEKDVDALRLAGYTATCNPQGAGKWTKVPDAPQILAGVDVMIVADADNAGRAHAKDVARSLRPVAASVTVLEPATGKDAAEHLAAGRPVDELTIVAGTGPDDPPLERWLLASSDEQPTDSEHADPFPNITFRQIPDPFVIPPLTWLAKGLIVDGTHGEMAGPEKSLKSYIATATDVALAAGVDVLGRWPVTRPTTVLILIGEGGEPAFLRRTSRICTGYGIPIGDIRSRLHYTTQAIPVSSPRFTDGLKQELDATQPTLVHLDPWYAYAPSETDARNLYETGAALERIGALVREGGATLSSTTTTTRPATEPGCVASPWPDTPNGATAGGYSTIANQPTSTAAASSSSSTSAHANGAADHSTSTSTSAATTST
jgi:AAA domain